MKQLLNFLLVLSVSVSFSLIFPSVTWAANDSGVLVGLGLLKYDRENDGPQIGNGKDYNTYYDLKIGYITPNNLYLGGIYSVYNHDDGNNESKRTLYGLTVGYHNAGWYLDGSYFFDGNWDRGNSEFRKASGIGIDVGYRTMVSGNFYLGVQGSYKTYTFKEYKSGTTTLSEENKVRSELYPMLTLGIIF